MLSTSMLMDAGASIQVSRYSPSVASITVTITIVLMRFAEWKAPVPLLPALTTVRQIIVLLLIQITDASCLWSPGTDPGLHAVGTSPSVQGTGQGYR